MPTDSNIRVRTPSGHFRVVLSRPGAPPSDQEADANQTREAWFTWRAEIEWLDWRKASELLDLLKAVTGQAPRFTSGPQYDVLKHQAVSDLKRAIECGVLRFERMPPPRPIPARALNAYFQQLLDAKRLEYESQRATTPSQLRPRAAVAGVNSFEVRFVDEIGQGIAGLEVKIRADGESHRLMTDGSGHARLDGMAESSATASVVDTKQLTDIVEPRWEKARTGSPPKAPAMVKRTLRSDLTNIRLETRTPLLVVIGPALGRLHVELFDRTGRVRHASRSYTISGPTSYSGTTDDMGRLQHDEVFPGDYQLSFTLESFAGTPDEVVETYESSIVVLSPAQSGPQVRMLGAVPNATLARVLGGTFERNKALLLPAGIELLRSMGHLYTQNSPGKLMVVGHTDASGDPGNEQLSIQRAELVAAYLRHDIQPWLDAYGAEQPELHRWGPREDRLMISAMADFASRPAELGPVRWFQETRGLKVDGQAGKVTRTELIGEYMDLAADELPGEDSQWAFEISAHGAGEHFPLSDESGGDKPPDGLKDSRFELFFFDEEFGIVPAAGAADGPEYERWASRATIEEFVVEPPDRRQLHQLPLTDAFFRTESAVMLPEGESPTTGDGTALSSVGSLAVVLRFNEERDAYKLLVTGHTDSVGTDDFNDKLSEQRAETVHSVLVNDRVRFGDLCHETHTVSDYKQILSWASEALARVEPLAGSATGPTPSHSFANCDPGQVDDDAYSAIEPLKDFQRAYNANQGPLGAANEQELAVDGDIGPKTWRAICDCYQYNMARELGVSISRLREMQSNLTFLATKQPFVGFGEHKASDSTTNDLESQSERRVDVLLFQEGEEPDVSVLDSAPKDSEIYDTSVYHHERIRLDSARPSLDENDMIVVCLDENGEPLPGLDVVAGSSGSVLSQAVTNGAGKARLFDLTDAAINVTVKGIDETSLPQSTDAEVLTAAELDAGIDLQPGEKHVIHVGLGEYLVECDAVEEDPAVFELSTTDGSFSQTLAAPRDGTAFEGGASLLFRNLPSLKSFTLKGAPGKEALNVVFESKTFLELFTLSDEVTAKQVLPFESKDDLLSEFEPPPHDGRVEVVA